MLPPPRPKPIKVQEDEWIAGEILDIEYEMEHRSMFKGKERVAPAVKIFMQLEGYDKPKSSGWLTFNYSEKSNLFKTYVLPLVEGAKPFMEFDLDNLKGIRIKTMWETNPKNPDFQNLVRIKPVGDKVKADAEPPESAIPAEEVPF